MLNKEIEITLLSFK